MTFCAVVIVPSLLFEEKGAVKYREETIHISEHYET